MKALVAIGSFDDDRLMDGREENFAGGGGSLRRGAVERGGRAVREGAALSAFARGRDADAGGGAVKSRRIRRGGEREEALQFFLRALALQPDFVPSHASAGIVLRELGRLDEAEAHHREATRLAPDRAELHLNLGNVLLAQRRRDQAEAEFRQALR